MSLIEINQFRDMKFSDCVVPPDNICPSVTCYQNGEELLKSMNIDTGATAKDWIVLISTFGILALVGYYATRWKVNQAVG